MRTKGAVRLTPITRSGETSANPRPLKSLMARCAASKPNGEPCERIVGASQTYCFAHDPNRAAERARSASKAARTKPTRELSDVKKRLRQLAEDVMVARADRGMRPSPGSYSGRTCAPSAWRSNSYKVEDSV
jgi:hypothetical protein